MYLYQIYALCSKIDDEWIAIQGADAQVEKYIGELWNE